MNFGILIAMALREISAHKFRSFLSMLGILLGVSSLIATLALSAGIARGMRTMMEQMGGLELVNVADKDASMRNVELTNLSPGRTLADAYIIRDNVPNVTHIAPELVQPMTASVGAHSEWYRVLGIWPDHLVVHKHEVDAGRFIADMDVERSTRVAVIGSLVARALFPGLQSEQILERTIMLGDSPFTVVGVLTNYENEVERNRRERAERASAGQSPQQRNQRQLNRWDPYTRKNQSVFIPISTMFYEFQSGRFRDDSLDTVRVNNIAVRVGNLDAFQSTLEQVRSVLNITRRGVDDFDFDTREEWFGRMESSITATRTSGGLIAMIALVVGGIGIANIMLASITERIREIGIRLAVGARGRDIFAQVLVESVVVSFIGGLIGMVTGVAFLRVIMIVAPQDNTPVLEFSSFVISVVFAVAAGILSGLYPAMKASRLDPITALRYE